MLLEWWNCRLVKLDNAMSQREHFHFSVTIQSWELFMVSAMRRLAWQCQPQINRQIAIAGASNAQWKRNQGKATFYFTSTANRAEFLSEISLIFPTGWEKISRDEKRIAPRQNLKKALYAHWEL